MEDTEAESSLADYSMYSADLPVKAETEPESALADEWSKPVMLYTWCISCQRADLGTCYFSLGHSHSKKIDATTFPVRKRDREHS